MENQEIFFVGIVMGWESKSVQGCCETFNPAAQVVTEFCPWVSISGGLIKPNAR
jgi:hypothetical protein